MQSRRRRCMVPAAAAAVGTAACCRRRHRALSRRAANPSLWRTRRIADTVGCRLLCGMRALLATPLFLLLHFENVENVVRHVETVSRTRLKKQDECKRVEKQKKM